MKEVMETNTEGDEDKKGSQCLTRWEESLSKCTSFAQIFIHLDTLDRSILWDKSIHFNIHDLLTFALRKADFHWNFCILF